MRKREKMREAVPVTRQERKTMHRFSVDQVKSIYDEDMSVSGMCKEQPACGREAHVHAATVRCHRTVAHVHVVHRMIGVVGHGDY